MNSIIAGRFGHSPVHLGDKFQDGRYTVPRKLGWGEFSTVWAARDNPERKYVALKISPVVKREGMRKRMENEKRFIRFNGTMKSKPDEFDCNPASLTGSDQLAATYDHFVLEGPSGQTGSSCIDKRKKEDGTLPRELVRRNAKDSLLDLRTLHGLGLAHGDLRISNLAFAPPPMDHLKEEEICQKPGEHVIKKEWATNSSKMCVPKYMVQLCEFSEERSSQWLNVKISDFGENVNTGKRGEIVIPTAYRASEVVCKAPYDHRIDLWNMSAMQSGRPLQERLEEISSANGKMLGLSREEMANVGEIIGKMLRIDTSGRASAAEILEDPWFRDAQC
ncbi:kinase-like domain-containing protein [Phyllosticta citriasiana]|uniref:Kinase-like domain-containing protein n=1 Tax=Phyllosticta citriasiana TaxID=595635 RepID=A0ABR1KA33_9PEZI